MSRFLLKLNMKFITYLKNEFESRLEESGVLVVFDPDRRYESAFDKLASDECELVKELDQPSRQGWQKSSP